MHYNIKSNQSGILVSTQPLKDVTYPSPGIISASVLAVDERTTPTPTSKNNSIIGKIIEFVMSIFSSPPPSPAIQGENSSIFLMGEDFELGKFPFEGIETSAFLPDDSPEGTVKYWYETPIYEEYADQVEGAPSSLLDASGFLAGNTEPGEPSPLPESFEGPRHWYETSIDAIEDYEKDLPEIPDETQIEGQPTPLAETTKSTVSASDQVLAASNAIQWGLIAAAGYGIAPGVTVPISFLTSLASEVATFKMLPKDASLFRQAISFPLISKALINYNPTIGRCWQAFSLYNLMVNSGVKLADAWKMFNQDPVKALKEGALHLFNLSSGAAFAAESTGLINLKPQQETGPCDPKKEKDCSGPIDQRRIKFITVFDNKGNHRRNALSERTSGNHKKYAEHWGYSHEVVSGNLVEKDCTNPITGVTSDCSPYWNKIKYFKNWCEAPSNHSGEEWSIYADDDAIYTNFQIDPSKAIDQVRGGKDTSFIIATEGPGTRYQPGAVNTGVMIVRKDPKGCGVIEKIWANRNVVTDPNDPNCPTYGLCKNQKNGDEQGATDKVFWRDAPKELGRVATRVLARDKTHPIRGKIAFNTLNRGGCVKAQLPDGSLGGAINILEWDLKTNPAQIWQEGDWIGQTAGYPLYGQDLSHQPLGKCADDSSIPIEPIRLKRVDQMIEAAEKTLNPDYKGITNIYDEAENIYLPCSNFSKSPHLATCPRKKNLPFRTVPLTRKITLGAAYNNNGNKDRNDISNYSNENHSEYAFKWDVNHDVVEGNLVANGCTDPKTNKPADCAPFWNKIALIRDWLNEPKSNKVDEEWRMYFDDDMLVMNQNIDPNKAIDQLREGSDTSVIIAKDVIDWQRWFFNDTVPDMAVNTGAFIVRKDERARMFFDALWDYRNTPVEAPTDVCPTIGMCQTQDRSMHEQEAWTMVLRQNPEIVGDIVSVIAPRDNSSPTRSNIAMNTFYRKGCFQRIQKNWPSDVFTYEEGDKSEYPEGAFQKGDWLTQVAGVPVWGKDLPRTWGNCIKREDIKPSHVRFNKLKELGQQVVRD